MNHSCEEQPECPLCMEPFEVDDVNFFPCTCLYQICRFCWHRIRTDENGLCPACRKAYPENPADFKPLSQEQVAKLKAEKRHKEQQRKQKATESRKHLANVRVVQKNLVFVVGLPIRLADPAVLKKHDYFGKFGRIHKVVINQSTSYAGAMGPSASAYVTYHKWEDTLRAIQAVNNISVDSRVLKASLGTTKYCSQFIKSQACPKQDCMYLHDMGDPEASFTKEEMQQGKHQEYEKKLHEQLNSNSLPGAQQDRKTNNGSPTGGGGGTAGGATTGKEAWPSLQLGPPGQAQTVNVGGIVITATDVPSANAPCQSIPSTATTTTTPDSNSTTSTSTTSLPPATSTTTTNKQTGRNKQNKDKQTNNKRKGKEKQLNGINNNNSSNPNNNHIEDKLGKERSKPRGVEHSGGSRQTEASLANSRVILPSHRTSLFGGDNNSFFSSNNFTTFCPNGLKEIPGSSTKTADNDATELVNALSSETSSSEDLSNLSNLSTLSNLTRSDMVRLHGREDEDTRAEAPTAPLEKPLTNGYGGGVDASAGIPHKYQNGMSYLNHSHQNVLNHSNSHQNVLNHLLGGKLNGEMKPGMDLIENADIFLGQQNYLIKQHLAQQQRPQQQQMLHQQNAFQQQQQFAQDYRALGPAPVNGHSQHMNYLHHAALLQQQQQKQMMVNSFQQPEEVRMLSQHKYIENGFNGFSNVYKDTELGVDDKGVRIADDELGFDPFHETQKALADLMEKELRMKNKAAAAAAAANRKKLQEYDMIDLPLQLRHQQQLPQHQHQQVAATSKLLQQIQSQQQQLANQRPPGGHMDGVRCSLPPPGFASSPQTPQAPHTSQSPQALHMNSFGLGVSRSNCTSKVLPYMGLVNGDLSPSQYHSQQYLPNGISQSTDWPDGLRSLLQDSSMSPSSMSPNYNPHYKGWSNIGNCSDWTMLDPAIVSSSRPHHHHTSLALHAQALMTNEGLSHQHGHQPDSHLNWQTNRPTSDDWTSHIGLHNSALPPPGFASRHGGDMKKTLISGLDGLQ